MRGMFRRQRGDDAAAPNLHDRILRPERVRRRVAGRAIGHVQRRLVAGVLVFLPIFVTYFVVDFFYGIIDSLLDPVISYLGVPHGPGIDVTDVVEIIIIMVILYGTGLLIGWAVTRLLIDRVHDTIGRVPIIGPVYNTTRHGIDFLSDTKNYNYRGVVLLEFPRMGVLSIGLITSGLGEIRGGEEYLSVYVPTTPVPSSGYLVIVRANEVTPTDISVDEAMRMIISGGILAGDIFKDRVILEEASSSWPGREWVVGKHARAATSTRMESIAPLRKRKPAAKPEEPEQSQSLDTGARM